MKPVPVPAAIRQRLGDEASTALIEMTYAIVADAIETALARATDRFERRLAEEIAGLRVEIRDMRVELIKWSFLFWTGQLVAVAALLAVMR